MTTSKHRLALFLGERELAYDVGSYVQSTCAPDIFFVCLQRGKPDLFEVMRFAPTLGVCCQYRHILPPELLAWLPIVNLHTSYLPWNRGANPNVWPIVDGSPAGVSLHWLDNGIDTGPLIAQKRVHVLPTDTGKTLDDRLQAAGLALFLRHWPDILDGSAPRYPQPAGGSYHTTRDFKALCERTNAAIRALTYPPYRNLEVMSE